MGKRLRREEIVTIEVLAKKEQNRCEIARTLGVTEGTVRYHLRRAAEGARDGRKDQVTGRDHRVSSGSVLAALEFRYGQKRRGYSGVSQATVYRKLASLHGVSDSGPDSQI